MQATFGTTLNATAAGNGSVALNPPGGLYPYGTVVNFYAIPETNSYFVLWGNAGAGTNNPLSYTVTNPDASVSAAFANLGSKQASVGIFPDGDGRVTISPGANRFKLGQSVSILAEASAGQRFLGWSGDAESNQNPLVLLVNQSKSIRAQFSKTASLLVGPCFGGWSETGFQFSLKGDWGSRYTVESSSNMINWTSLFDITNRLGQIQLFDPAATNASPHFYRAVLLP